MCGRGSLRLRESRFLTPSNLVAEFTQPRTHSFLFGATLYVKSGSLPIPNILTDRVTYTLSMLFFPASIWLQIDLDLDGLTDYVPGLLTQRRTRPRPGARVGA